MTDQFGTSSDDQAGKDEGNNFGQNTDGATTPPSTDQGIDSAEYEALRKRDENAQAHITRLESENEEARNKVVELQEALSKATTLDEALDKMSNQGADQPQGVDRTDVAQIVEDVLGQKQTQAMQETNWSTVQSSLTETYGSWKDADAKVAERAGELDISLEDATKMARQNPKAFLQLFVPQGTSTPTSSIGSGDMGQRGVSSQSGDTRDKAWYANLRKTDPNKYWSVDIQAQMRRDLYNH